MNRSSLELFSRLSAVGALLTALALAGTASTIAPITNTEAVSDHTAEASNASTVATEPLPSRGHAIEMALAEIRTTRAVLEQMDLTGEAQFVTYLENVDSILTAYENSSKATRDMAALAVTLAVARAGLENQLTTLASWLALSRVIRPVGARYVEVPPRFRAPTRLQATNNITLTAADLLSDV